ncbi:Splicing factor U2af large subunit B [Capsicum chinense]|nr:Splicing factor U2af large subunit B [Capsicum chinense]
MVFVMLRSPYPKDTSDIGGKESSLQDDLSMLVTSPNAIKRERTRDRDDEERHQTRDYDQHRDHDKDRESRHRHKSRPKGRSERRSMSRSHFQSKSKRISGFDMAPPTIVILPGATTVAGQVPGTNPTILGMLPNMFSLASGQGITISPPWEYLSSNVAS